MSGESTARKLYDYDPVDALASNDAIEAFLADAVETGDTEHIAKARDVVAAAKKRMAAEVTSPVRAPRQHR
jgi:DNA-binding phage protein